jgi:(1->4)-alpha-D-glucan 1-alpha-D-glucosylmutase
MRIPVSTYRIQFSLAFRYVDGRDLVPYLNDLGITDLYSSPRFKARRGSPHAYDVANPLRINSELGTEEEFEELAQKLQAYGMGMLLDIVPNHMAASSENPWWMDLLENGRSSIYASHFAVDWERRCVKTSGRERVVLPILSDLYGHVLENREFSLKLDENGFYARYYGHRLPLDPKSYRLILEQCPRDVLGPQALREFDRLMNEIEALPAPATGAGAGAMADRHRRKEELKRKLWEMYNANPELKESLDDCLITISGAKGEPGSFDLMDRILSEQHYRVAYWRMAFEDLNYRRFFDITDLVAVRVEDAEVFDSRHPELVNIIKTGYVTGLRIDHIDGLWDPCGYLERLQSRLKNGGVYAIVEKILGGDEELPSDWPTAGTTGYDFLNYLNSLFVDREGLAKLGALYTKFTGMREGFAEVGRTRKKQVMEQLFAGEVRALGFHLGRLAAQDRLARDLPFADMLRALGEVTARLPVYRTYTRSFQVAARDRAYLERALAEAERAGGVDPEVFGFLRRVLLLEIPYYIEDRDAWLDFVMSWQQFTGSVAAKGFEDTACYVYNRLVSQNEVGSDPGIADAPLALDQFHERNRARRERWPHTLNATSTHDTKRSEDVRARINVLSEIPGPWARRVARWSAWNEPKKKPTAGGGLAPDRNDEMLLYQTLVGVWPLCAGEMPGLADRVKNYMQKAVREAKAHTSWLSPDEAYEQGLLAFIDAILEQSDGNAFLKDFVAFHARIAPGGAVNALAQALLKIASPGVPDFYQGTELWDFSLVDPDNRRPVDFASRGAMLEELKRREGQELPKLMRELCSTWRDGRIKLYLTYKGLNFRRAHAGLFLKGDYLPLEAGERVCAFARRLRGKWAVAAAPRLVASRARAAGALLPLGIWAGDGLKLPAEAPRRWRNVFTGEGLEANSKGVIRLAKVFASFPVALLDGGE